MIFIPLWILQVLGGNMRNTRIYRFSNLDVKHYNQEDHKMLTGWG